MKKAILFSLLPLLSLMILGELALRIAYFQNRSENVLALQSAYEKIRSLYLSRKANETLSVNTAALKNVDKLYGPEGSALFADFQRQYEEAFRRLREDVKSVNAKLVLLYVPQDNYEKSVSLEPSRRFFESLAKRYAVDFIDVTPVFLKHRLEDVTLLPENGHLSRFGNALVASEVGAYLKKLGDYRSGRDSSANRKVALLGDLKPNDSNVSFTMESIPYRPVTNAQGLRGVRDVESVKKKQRVLALGDSFTYGPYLPVFHTYPHLLQARNENLEVLNAGVAGYTITDEAELFNERARFSDPDVVVLQVLDNDLTGFFSFIHNQFDRKRRKYEPSKLEIEFFRKVMIL